MLWNKRVFRKRQGIIVVAAMATVGIATALATFAATNLSPDTQTQRFIDQGYEPAACNVMTPGHHHCNMVVPVDKQGHTMRAKTFKDAQTLRHNTAATVPPNGVYTPQQLHTAYQLPCTPGGPVQGVCPQPQGFGPATIAVVDAGSYAGPGTIESSLAAYDTQFGLPSCTQANGCLAIVNQSGNSSPLPPPLPSSAGWDGEFDLDIQTAHMICQTCKILLVESTDDGNSLDAAVATAASFHPTSISLSWGGVNVPADNADFQFKGIAVVGSAGDSGSDEAQGFPGDIASVVNTAGTTLSLNADNTWKSETVWAGSGGGCALSGYPAPSWQTNLPNWNTAGCGSSKGSGDLSAMADPTPGVAEYTDGNWAYSGGTSLSTAIVAGAFALSGGIPASEYGSQYIYQNATTSNLHDITQGNDCTATISTHCAAGVGFDEPSGLGAFTGLGLFKATTPILVGDLNNDGKVNIYDLSILLSHWGQTGATTSTGDLNGDGIVNIFDLSALLSHWTG